MNELPNLDPAALQRLHRLGGEGFVRKMLDLFRDFAGSKIREAGTALAAENWEGVERAAHPIKSSAGNVGAVRVQDLAERLELRAHEARTKPPVGPGPSAETISDLLNELEKAFAEVNNELERPGIIEATAPRNDLSVKPREQL